MEALHQFENCSAHRDQARDIAVLLGNRPCKGCDGLLAALLAEGPDPGHRDGQPYAGQTLGPNSTLTIQVTGQGGVPSSGVSAVVLNVTVVNPSAPLSYLTVYPAGVPRPLASNLNFIGGQTVPNRVIVPVSSSGQITLYNNVGSVDVVIDVGGYFTDASNPGATGSLFTGMTPFRIADTRSGSGEPYAGQTVGPGGTLSIQVAGVGGVPSMSSTFPPRAVVLNVTVTDAVGTSYLTVYPSDAARPLASDLNVGTGQTIPNLVVVKLSATGTVTIYNNTGQADIVVDLEGWYA